MIDWYWAVLNTGYCNLTILQTASLAAPLLLLAMAHIIVTGIRNR